MFYTSNQQIATILTLKWQSGWNFIRYVPVSPWTFVPTFMVIGSTLKMPIFKFVPKMTYDCVQLYFKCETSDILTVGKWKGSAGLYAAELWNATCFSFRYIRRRNVYDLHPVLLSRSRSNVKMSIESKYVILFNCKIMLYQYVTVSQIFTVEMHMSLTLTFTMR